MDRGRQIDNIQNCNAVFIDRFGKSGKTSTRVINPPGGKDHFSLGWDEPPKEPQRQPPQQQYGRQHEPYEANKPRIDRRRNEQELPRNIPQHGYNKPPQNQQQQYQQPQQHTSVRVNQRPGGNSNIIFGSDDSNYDHYRK